MGTGQGIAGMKERAGIYAGTVTAGPGLHGGWVVEAVLTPPPSACKQWPPPDQQRTQS